jgi:gliding motility-associated-like protein
MQIGTAAVPGMQYQWSNGSIAATQMISPLVDTILILSVTDGMCHYSFDTISISVLPLPIPSITYNMNCNNVTFNNNSGTNTYQWFFGDGDSSTVDGPSHTYQTNGTFLVNLIMTNINGCSSLATQLLNINSNQQPAMSYSFVPCDSVYNFQNQSLNTTGSFWRFGDSGTSSSLNASHTYSRTGLYNVQLITTSQNGCIDTIDKTLFVVLKTPAVFNYIVDSCASKVIFTSNSPQALSYRWDFGDNNFSTQANPVHTFSSEGNYNVTLTVNNGTVCPASLSRDVIAPDDGLFNVYIPNSFTPNGDGVNDVFKIISKLPCDTYKFIIYDRWGGKIFETNDPLNSGWDGYHDGYAVAEGDYIYYLIGTKSTKSGNLVLTR